MSKGFGEGLDWFKKFGKRFTFSSSSLKIVSMWKFECN